MFNCDKFRILVLERHERRLEFSLCTNVECDKRDTPVQLFVDSCSCPLLLPTHLSSKTQFRTCKSQTTKDTLNKKSFSKHCFKSDQEAECIGKKPRALGIKGSQSSLPPSQLVSFFSNTDCFSVGKRFALSPMSPSFIQWNSSHT